MSLLKKFIRFSWDVAKNPSHAWGGTSDRSVMSMVHSRLDNLMDVYAAPVKDNTKEQFHVAVPMVLVMRNSKHPLISERNFWRNKEASKESYYPKDWGVFLTSEERDKVQLMFGIKPEHRFVFHMLPDTCREEEFVSRLAMTHAMTTYTIPRVMSLDDLSKIIASNNFGDMDKTLEEIQQSSLLILTDVLGSSDALRKASGPLTALLKARMCNGRTTVFTDQGHLAVKEAEPNKVSPFGHTNQSLEKAVRDGLNGPSIMSTPLASFIFGSMTLHINYYSFGKHQVAE